MAMQAEKLTISLPRDLIELADQIAAEKGISRSKVVASCLQELAKKRLRQEMEEGYKALAEEHLKFAREAAGAARQVVLGQEQNNNA